MLVLLWGFIGMVAYLVWHKRKTYRAKKAKLVPSSVWKPEDSSINPYPPHRRYVVASLRNGWVQIAARDYDDDMKTYRPIYHHEEPETRFLRSSAYAGLLDDKGVIREE